MVTSGSTLYQGLLDLILPPRCFLCGAFDRAENKNTRLGFCPDCLAGLTPMPEACCFLCGRPFETDLVVAHACAQCIRQRPWFDRAGSAGIYEGLLQKAIHRLKYSAQTELAKPLARFMARQLSPPFYPPETDLILPVPLHRRRLKQRGFNQSLLLARALFAPLKHRVRADLLVRSRWTVPQTNLSGVERRKNVKQAFSVPKPELIKDRSVLVVDDVFTTGATVGECSRALKKAGASRVMVLTLARVK